MTNLPTGFRSFIFVTDCNSGAAYKCQYLLIYLLTYLLKMGSSTKPAGQMLVSISLHTAATRR